MAVITFVVDAMGIRLLPFFEYRIFPLSASIRHAEVAEILFIVTSFAEAKKEDNDVNSANIRAKADILLKIPTKTHLGTLYLPR